MTDILKLLKDRDQYETSLDIGDDLFKKNSEKLAEETIIYNLYYLKLKEEEERAKRAEERAEFSNHLKIFLRNFTVSTLFMGTFALATFLR